MSGTEPDNVELVRRLWEAFERGGIEAVLEIADEDVEWEPYGATSGTVYRGHDGLRAYMEWRAERNEEADARLYSAFAKGDYVVGRGEVRIRGPQGMFTMQPGWLYEFRDGKLVRFRGFPTQEAALRAAGLVAEDPTAVVRELWSAFNRGGIDGMLRLVAEDATWHTYLGASEVYDGHEGIRRYFDDVTGGAVDATVTEYSIRQVGEAVVVSGSLQTVESNGALAQRQIHWAYWVRDGKIQRAASYPLREQALAAAETFALPPAPDS
ncbi:MAG: nuclear transport factor 2 family protein [Thermoleophilaceae bacterium]